MIIGYFYLFEIFNAKESRMLHPLLQYAVELANEKVSCSICISMHLKILFYTDLHVYLHICFYNI